MLPSQLASSGFIFPFFFSHFNLRFLCFSYPSAKDSMFNERYEGKSVVVIICPVNFEWFRELELGKKRGEGYKDLKQKFEDRLMKIFFHYHPELQDKIKFLGFNFLLILSWRFS